MVHVGCCLGFELVPSKFRQNPNTQVRFNKQVAQIPPYPFSNQIVAVFQATPSRIITLQTNIEISTTADSTFVIDRVCVNSQSTHDESTHDAPARYLTVRSGVYLHT